MTIDELVVELKLDPANFSKGQKDALEAFRKTSDEFEKRLKGLEERNKKTSEGFGDMTHAAQGLFTTLGGAGLAAFARETVNAAAATGRVAVNIGIAEKEASAFGRTIARNGGNAAAATENLKGLADQMNRLNQTGQASQDFITGLSKIGGSQTEDPLSLFFKLSKFADHNSVSATRITGQQLGLSDDLINQALRGSVKTLKEYKEAYDGALNPDQVAKLSAMQRGWEKMSQSLTSVGNEVLTRVAPMFSSIFEGLSGWIDRNRGVASTIGLILSGLTALSSFKMVGWAAKLLGLGGVAGAAGGVSALPGMVLGGKSKLIALPLMLTGLMKHDANNGNELRTALRDALGIDDPGEASPYFTGAKPNAKKGAGAFGSQDEKEAFIRKVAGMFNINPDTAVAVAKHEGFSSFVSAVPGETSYGAFQLHVTPGGRGGHLGDQFRKETGLDPSDPANEHESIVYALRDASRNGWKHFHGAKNSGIGPTEGINVATLNVTLPGVTDAKGFARDLPGATNAQVARQIATNANTGQRP